jgi:hypothetical protein
MKSKKGSGRERTEVLCTSQESRSQNKTRLAEYVDLPVDRTRFMSWYNENKIVVSCTVTM